MTKQVIGIVGTIGAGKDTAAEYLAKKLGIPTYQISAPLKHILAENGDEPTRENLIKLGTSLAAEKGESYLAKYIVENGPNAIIITGMRQLGQIAYLKESTQLTLIAIDANPAIRFDRIKQSSDIAEAKTLAEFINSEKAENSPPNVQRLFECMKLTDYHIVNNGSLDDFNEQLDLLTHKLTLK